MDRGCTLAGKRLLRNYTFTVVIFFTLVFGFMNYKSHRVPILNEWNLVTKSASATFFRLQPSETTEGSVKMAAGANITHQMASIGTRLNRTRQPVPPGVPSKALGETAGAGELYNDGFPTEEDPGLIRYITGSWLHQPSVNNSRRSFTAPNSDYSQYGQSRFVDELLKGRRGGFYVECGAADGLMYSNSAFFELDRGWRGLLIEPNHLFFEKLMSRSRNAYCISACLSTRKTTQTVRFKEVGYLGAIDGKMDETHRRHIQNNPGFLTERKVQCFTLYSIMLAVGVTHIDYLSLDIEGAELEVLQTIPYDKLFIDVIGVEYRVWGGHVDYNATLIKLDQFRAFFKATGLYTEVGIIPRNPAHEQKLVDLLGLDVFFRRLP